MAYCTRPIPRKKLSNCNFFFGFDFHRHVLQKCLSYFLYLILFNFFPQSYEWEAIDLDNKISYTLKLCDSSPLTPCGEGTAVCARNLTSNVYRSVGESVTSFYLFLCVSPQVDLLTLRLSSSLTVSGVAVLIDCFMQAA